MEKGDRVQYIDKIQNEKFGVFSIMDIKGDFAICGYSRYGRMGIVWNCKLTELIKEV